MIIIGDGIDRNLLERKIKDKNLSRIKVTGYENPYPYYSDASIFVFPSFSEGFGMSLIEAMAYQCVPIVFDTSRAFHDIIDNGYNGFIIEDYKKSKFISKCDELMSQDISFYASNAREKIKKFSIHYVGTLWQNLFKELIKNEDN